MIVPDSNSPQPVPSGAPPPKAKTPLAIYIILMVTIGGVILSWRSCSYLVPLTDSQVTDYLASGDEAKIHRALSQVDDRIVNKVPDVEQFFPRVIELSTHESAVIRIAAAWVMGDAREYVGFAAPLRAMLEDTNLAARLQAACGLARRGEDLGRPILVEALDDYAVRALKTSVVESMLTEGEPVRAGDRVARLTVDGETVDITSPLDGVISDAPAEVGGTLAPAEPILLITPSDDQVHSALVALLMVGTKDDIGAVRRVLEQDRASRFTLEQARHTLARLEAK